MLRGHPVLTVLTGIVGGFLLGIGGLIVFGLAVSAFTHFDLISGLALGIMLSPLAAPPCAVVGGIAGFRKAIRDCN